MLNPGNVPSNRFKKRLKRNEPSCICAVRLARTIDIAGILAAAGHHAFYIDLGGDTLSADIAAQICMAGVAMGVTPFARLPNLDPGLAQSLLAKGAQGLIAPVASKADATTLVRFCKFPPHGDRTAGGTIGPNGAFRKVPLSKFQRKLDDETMAMGALQTEAAMKAAGEIAAVEGIDALMVASVDLTIDMGLPGQFIHPRFKDLCRAAIEGCAAHGKKLIVEGIADPEIVTAYVAMGAARCYVTGDDTGFLFDGAQKQASAMRAVDEEFDPT